MVKNFTVIKWDSPIYKETLMLRNKVLKASSGKPFITCSPLEEKYDFHLVATLNNQLVGTLLLHPVSRTCVQIKQVAVDPNCQGQKIGKYLLTYAEELALSLGFTSIFLTGRQSAWGFYEKMSYQSTIEEYREGQLMLKVFRKDICPQTNLCSA